MISHSLELPSESPFGDGRAAERIGVLSKEK